MSSTNFRIGSVVRRFCDFVEPNKYKWCVVLSTDPICFAVLINTDVTPFAKSRPHLMEQNVPISAQDNPLLNHDSYVDCSELFVLSIGQCRQELNSGDAQIMGELSYQSLSQVHQTVRTSVLISPKHQKNIVKSLGEVLEAQDSIGASEMAELSRVD